MKAACPSPPVLAWVAGAFLLAPVSASAGVFINEFNRGPATDSVELYNDSVVEDLTGWFLVNADGDSLALSGSIGGGGYRTFSLTGFVLDGGQIELLDGTFAPQDQVPYGDSGGAPLPPQTPGVSCSRVTDGVDTGDPATDWTLDTTDTFGATNDPVPPSLGVSSVYLNEFGRDAGPAPARAVCPGGGLPLVELFNPTPVPRSLVGWWITDGNAIQPLSGAVPALGFLVINQFPPNFCFEQTGVIYLFNDTNARVDQVGFRGSSLPAPPANDFSWQRRPNGSGPYNGFDYVTSGGSATLGIFPQTFGNPNGPGPIVGTGAGTEARSWGRVKSLYR